jgi:hypothetical protein
VQRECRIVADGRTERNVAHDVLFHNTRGEATALDPID